MRSQPDTPTDTHRQTPARRRTVAVTAGLVFALATDLSLIGCGPATDPDAGPASSTSPASGPPTTTLAPGTTTTVSPDAYGSVPPGTVAPSTTATTATPPPSPTVTPTSNHPPTTAPPPITTSPPTTKAPGPATRVTHGTNGRPVVALSFDAGSDVGFTGQILDTLAANNIRASFGMTGTWAEKNPDLFRRIVADGHSIINHTYDHRSWTGRSTDTAPLTDAERRDELSRASTVFATLGLASPTTLFRPPYGDLDAGVDALVGRAGYSHVVMWSVDSRGWQGASADQIVDNVRPALTAGGILLFHVGSASQDANALPRIIEEIRARSLQPGAVPDVL